MYRFIIKYIIEIIKILQPKNCLEQKNMNKTINKYYFSYIKKLKVCNLKFFGIIKYG